MPSALECWTYILFWGRRGGGREGLEQPPLNFAIHNLQERKRCSNHDSSSLELLGGLNIFSCHWLTFCKPHGPFYKLRDNVMGWAGCRSGRFLVPRKLSTVFLAEGCGDLFKTVRHPPTLPVENCMPTPLKSGRHSSSRIPSGRRAKA